MKKLKTLYSLNQIPTESKIAIYGSGKIGSGLRKFVNE